VLPAVLASLVLTVAAPADSTTLLKMDVERLAREAVMVVQGHVAWDYSVRPDPQGPIFTYSGLEVSGCVAGECPETVVLKHEGGTVGELTIFIPGMPAFTPGDEVLLFLEPDPNGEKDTYYTVGMVQGYFKIVTDPQSGVKTAHQQLFGVTLAAPGASGVIGPVKSPGPLVATLQDLVVRIRKAWKNKKKGGGK
jgi:hypothetical protein